MNKYNKEKAPSLLGSSNTFSATRSPRSQKNINITPLIKSHEYKTVNNSNTNIRSNVMRKNLLKELDLKENQLLS